MHNSRQERHFGNLYSTPARDKSRSKEKERKGGSNGGSLPSHPCTNLHPRGASTVHSVAQADYIAMLNTLYFLSHIQRAAVFGARAFSQKSDAGAMSFTSECKFAVSDCSRYLFNLGSLV